jgi:hypothetical protein
MPGHLSSQHQDAKGVGAYALRAPARGMAGLVTWMDLATKFATPDATRLGILCSDLVFRSGTCTYAGQHPAPRRRAHSLERQVCAVLSQGMRLAGCLDQLKPKQEPLVDAQNPSQCHGDWTHMHAQVDSMHLHIASLAVGTPQAACQSSAHPCSAGYYSSSSHWPQRRQSGWTYKLRVSQPVRYSRLPSMCVAAAWLVVKPCA